MKDGTTWLLLLYQVPARPSTLRVGVWRRLKGCGVLYLQNSACVLPDRADLAELTATLKAEIGAGGGEAVLLRIRLADRDEAGGLVARFRAQSDEEYGELLGKCRDFHDELAKERRERHFTFAELEENEAELGKLSHWLPKIVARDFFTAPTRAKAEKAVAACERDLRRYADEVGAANGVIPNCPARRAKKRKL